jgi:hypothetical protein
MVINNAMTNIASATSSSAWLGSDNMPSPAWLDSDIAPWLTSTGRHHRQHDSAMTSHHGQRRLSSAIASMTRQRHHVMANVGLTTPSPSWLDGDNMPSPALLSSNIMPRPMSTWWHHHQHNSITTSYHGQRRLDSAITSKTWSLGKNHLLNKPSEVQMRMIKDFKCSMS